jgi:hypothetical protein
LKPIAPSWLGISTFAAVLSCAGPIHIPSAPLDPALTIEHEPGEATTSEPGAAQSIVLIALDGVRWQEVFEGVERDRAKMPPDAWQSAAELMPNLYRLRTRDGAAIGAVDRGPPMRASGPRYVSLPGYIEIFTGRPSPCTHNDCDHRPETTLADQLAAATPGPGPRAFVVSSWPKIAQAASAGTAGVAVSAGRTGGSFRSAFVGDPRGAEIVAEGEAASPKPSYGDFRPDRHTAALALHVLRQHRPGFLFVGLGETDEYAHHNNYKSYLNALRFSDDFIGEVVAELRASGTWATTTLIVTTDHGRSHAFHDHGDDEASGRVWLVAAGAGILARGAVPSLAPRRLADIAPTARTLLGLYPDPHPEAGEPIEELMTQPVRKVARRE